MRDRNSEGSGRLFMAGEAMTVWVLWLTYGSFYFCRTNISVAVTPGLQDELGFDGHERGLILGSFKLAYGIGQFINGQLSERFAARRLLVIGMLCSAALNVVFGLGTGLYFLLFVWAMNGYSQALGWTPCMRVAANWFPATRRGRRIGIVGTGYQAIGALTYVVAGTAAAWFGWRFAFYVPAVLLTASCVHMLFFLRESPADTSESGDLSPAAEPAIREDAVAEPAKVSFLQNVAVTLTNPALWFLAVSLGLLNYTRYGFIDWGVSHLIAVQGEGVGTAAVKYAVLPLGGIAGAYAAGWATDRFFSGRRAPVICVLLVALSLLAVAYNRVVYVGTGLTVLTLALVGFTIYGPQVLLVGTAPVDLARRGTAAAAVGFVNFMGYMGAFFGDQVTGSLIEEYDWEVPVYVWAAAAFAAAISTAFLWNTMAREKQP